MALPPPGNPVVLALRAYVALCQTGSEAEIEAATRRLRSLRVTVDDPIDARIYFGQFRDGMPFTRAWQAAVEECRLYLNGLPTPVTGLPNLVTP